MPIPTYEPSYGEFITVMPYENPGETKMSPKVYPKVYVDLPEPTMFLETNKVTMLPEDPNVCDEASASGRMAHLGFLYATCKFNISTGDSIMVKDSCPTKVILDSLKR